MRVVFRTVLVIAVLAVGAYLLGFWSPTGGLMGRWRTPTVAAGPVDTGSVRDRLDRLDEGAGRAVQKMDDFVSDAALSTKIKSKMALDELVRARTIDVSTTGGVVTLAGNVRSVAERDKALLLARDTKGITGVVDRLVVQP